MNRAVVAVAIVVVAVLAGIAVVFVAALRGHQFLVLTVGEERIPAIDDTPVMRGLVVGAYLAGGLAGLAVAISGWARFLRPRS